MAADTALGADELAACAERVGHLRTESARLLQQNGRLDAQRASLLDRRRGLESEPAPRADDLNANLARYERRQQLEDETLVFNEQIERIRGEIATLNGVWKEYDARCANRPYRRSDLERLPPDAQQAMRAGLADVQVPYIPDRMSAPAGAAAPQR